MKVIIEDKIPFIKGVIDKVAEVEYLPAASITASAMANADALITRTRTRCDAHLLEGSPCSFIGTATIGVDHIDLDYCQAHNIEVANAPGCNAPAVAQWVLATALRLAKRRPDLTTLGIVGVGHVGSLVAKWAAQLGFKTLLCDPPRARREGDTGFVDLDTIASQSDIITFHTPLTHEGDDATYHMADADFFAKCARKPIIMNSARGAIVDTPALVSAMRAGKVSQAAIDTWEGEPTSINRELLGLVTIATPHIAGYSLQGKVRATAMVLDAFSRHFGLEPLRPKGAHTAPPAAKVSYRDLLDSYDPFADTEMFLSNPAKFEALRDFYTLRSEP